eukprot:TRINITY_DN29098_c0_g1_i1.p1 TRINITY_DN29098_c0_g1~~TRINITY_DN29098_c0_g1_i1.p1  ORF type:complete len:498 (+),score=60.77 TRINITY_DN29098_c0_g1_i1:35-1495(+)
MEKLKHFAASHKAAFCKPSFEGTSTGYLSYLASGGDFDPCNENRLCCSGCDKRFHYDPSVKDSTRQDVIKQAGLRYCAACRAPNLLYCSRQCQKRDWPRHKTECMQRDDTRKCAAPSSSGYWWDRYVADSSGEAQAMASGAGSGQNDSTHGWWRKFRKTSDAESHGEKHRGRLELITWEGQGDGRKLGFAGRPVGPEADAEKARFYRDFVGSNGVDDDALLRYFNACVLSSRVKGTDAFRWTCCGSSHAGGIHCCDHHRAGCRCDYCRAGQPFESDDSDSIFAFGIPRPRRGEYGHPSSVTPEGMENWEKRQRFFRSLGLDSVSKIEQWKRHYLDCVNEVGAAAETLSNTSLIRKLPCGHTLDERSAAQLKLRQSVPHCPACSAVIPGEYLMDAAGMAKLAHEHLNKQTYNECFDWASRALQLDPHCADAYKTLGFLHYNGWGVPQDKRRALRFYESAYKHGSACAAKFLAHVLMETGELVRFLGG